MNPDKITQEFTKIFLKYEDHQRSSKILLGIQITFLSHVTNNFDQGKQSDLENFYRVSDIRSCQNLPTNIDEFIQIQINYVGKFRYFSKGIHHTFQPKLAMLFYPSQICRLVSICRLNPACFLSQYQGKYMKIAYLHISKFKIKSATFLLLSHFPHPTLTNHPLNPLCTSLVPRFSEPPLVPLEPPTRSTVHVTPPALMIQQ